MIGTTLDKYEVLQKVGEGGMATVYRGRHSTLDRTVAIKVLHPHLSSSTRNRIRFKREVEAIERLRHENILEIFDYSGNEVSDCYIVTEFVDGETLSAIVHRRGRLPSEVATQIAVALCRALGYAHSQQVLHRDVKPDNVMVRYDGTVKLMDFGIARVLDETRVTMTGALVGSPAFMSPEQAKEGKLDQRSDLFELGAVLFYLVTGHLPFTGSNPSLILKNVIEGNRPHIAELAPTMSAALADVVERLMATDPEDRFNTAADVERHLLGCLTEARIDPVAPEWSLASWMDDADAYEARLDEHLKRVLIDEGRHLLGIGDHLSALRLLNRLLSMDEDNAEVLRLVQGLHGEPAPAATRKARVLAAAALVAIGVGVSAMFVAARWAPAAESEADVSRPQEEPAPLEPAQLAAVPVITAPPVVAPEPVPEPAPVGVRPRPRAVLPPVPVPVVPAPVPEGTSDDAAAAVVRINAGDYVADVYRGGMRIGDTRSDLLLPVGTHELELRSPLLQVKTVKVTVASGERRVVPVTLSPRPSRVVFPRSIAADCLVQANRVDIGPLEALAWSWTVERPDEPLDLTITCPDGKTLQNHWNNLTAPEVQFPLP